MRKAGGVLTIIGGIIGIGIGIGVIKRIISGAGIIGRGEAPLLAFAIVALIIGIVALIGGIYALRARDWGFALAGGIVLIGIGAVIVGPLMRVVGEYLDLAFSWAPFLILGIPGTIFIASRKEEFE